MSMLIFTTLGLLSVMAVLCVQTRSSAKSEIEESISANGIKIFQYISRFNHDAALEDISKPRRVVRMSKNEYAEHYLEEAKNGIEHLESVIRDMSLAKLDVRPRDQMLKDLKELRALLQVDYDDYVIFQANTKKADVFFNRPFIAAILLLLARKILEHFGVSYVFYSVNVLNVVSYCVVGFIMIRFYNLFNFDFDNDNPKHGFEKIPNVYDFLLKPDSWDIVIRKQWNILNQWWDAVINRLPFVKTNI
jgi:hypothetical protein